MACAKAKRVAVPGKVPGLTLLPFAIPATRNRLAAEPPATVSAQGATGLLGAG